MPDRPSQKLFTWRLKNGDILIFDSCVFRFCDR
jgi:hypothetical protein